MRVSDEKAEAFKRAKNRTSFVILCDLVHFDFMDGGHECR